MRGLAAFVLRFFDLCEAEGRLLQENVLVTVRRCVFLSLGILFIAAAAAFFLGAAYFWLRLILPVPACLVIIGAACVCLGVFLLLLTRGGRRAADAAGKGGGS